MFDDLKRDKESGLFVEENKRHAFDGALSALRELFEKLDTLLDKYIPTTKVRKVTWMMRGLSDAMVYHEEIARCCATLNLTFQIANFSLGLENKRTLATIQKQQTRKGGSLRPTLSHKSSQRTDALHIGEAESPEHRADSAIDMTSPTKSYEKTGGLGTRQATRRLSSETPGTAEIQTDIRELMASVLKLRRGQSELMDRAEAWLDSIYEPDASHRDVEEAVTEDYPEIWSLLASWKELVLSEKMTAPPLPSASIKPALSPVVVPSSLPVIRNEAAVSIFGTEQQFHDSQLMLEQYRVIFAAYSTEKAMVQQLDPRLAHWLHSAADYAKSVLADGGTTKSLISTHESSNASRNATIPPEDSFLVENETFLEPRPVPTVHVTRLVRIGERDVEWGFEVPVSYNRQSTSSLQKPESTPLNTGASQASLPSNEKPLLDPQSLPTGDDSYCAEASLAAYLVGLVEALMLWLTWEAVLMMREGRDHVVALYCRALKKMLSDNQGGERE